MNKVGIVLSGGGAKGAFEVGALEVILRRINMMGDDLVGVCGTSIGAFNAAFVASGQFKVLKDAWLNFTPQNCPMTQSGMLGPIGTLLTQGHAYKAKPLYDFLKKNLDMDAYLGSDVKCINTFVRLGDGEMYHGGNFGKTKKDADRAIKEIMASMAIVPWLDSVKMDGLEYVDGGFRDTVPVKSLIDHCPDLDIIYIVNCNPEKRKWDDALSQDGFAGLLPRLNFFFNDILWDENNRSDIEIGKLKFWGNSQKFRLIFPEQVDLSTGVFDGALIRQAINQGGIVARLETI
jgi:NTE family protein